jgi:Mn2+/Fe2+ NRAMP family transporter
VAKKSAEKAAENKNKGFLGRLGPGLITGASDDDPSGIGTYSRAGAQVGFGIGWTMLLTYPLMAAIQEISARVGRVTGHGIAGNVCRNFPAPVLWSLIILLFIANTINVAADLGGWRMRFGSSLADQAFYTLRYSATFPYWHKFLWSTDATLQFSNG